MNVALCSVAVRNLSTIELLSAVDTGTVTLTQEDILYVLGELVTAGYDEEALAEAHTEIEELQDQVSDLEGSLDEKNEEYLFIRDDRDEVQAELDQLHLEYIKLQDQLNELRSELE